MSQIFHPPPHHDVLVLLIQIAVLLFTARLLGELAQRIGQPSVVGEILAGIVLGPSLLSGIFPVVDEWLMPHNEVQGYLLETIGLLGVMLLLLITGLETDLLLIRNRAKSAMGVAIGGLVVPLAMGFGLGWLLPENLLVSADDRFVFSLFLGIAMAISAIPVVAKVLMDLQLTRRDVGQTIIAAAMIDDTTGWILLSVVVGIASGQGLSLGIVLGSAGNVLLFMALSFTIGLWFVRHLMRFVQNRVQSRDKVLTLVMILTFIWGAASHALNLEAMLGAFILGILFSQIPTLDTDIVHKIESITLGLFSPIFFSIAGLKVDIQLLLEPQLIVVTLAVIAVAVICKVLGIYAGARLIGGSSHWEAIFFGAGLNARGSMGIIIASIGFSLDLLTQEMFSIIVLMAVTTSLMAPSGLRWALGHIEMDDTEKQRLRREEMNKTNIMASINRVLLPIRMRDISVNSPTQVVESTILTGLGTRPIALTLMTVTEAEAEGRNFINELTTQFSQPNLTITPKVSKNGQPLDPILEEVKRGYDLMVVGASQRQDETQNLFSAVIDGLIRLAPCPVLIVHSPQVPPSWQLRHILVATSGSTAGRHAAQLAFTLAENSQAEVTVIKVVEKSTTPLRLYTPLSMEERQFAIAHQIVDELKDMGQIFGVNVNGRVEIAQDAETGILQVARSEKVDLIILGTQVRLGSEHLYLGPKVERMLSNTVCPVLIINSGTS